MRIAFHAINGVGLGHVVRVLCLAKEIRALVPNVELLVVTNAGTTTLLETAGIDFVKLPPRLTEPHADPDRSQRALPEPLEEAALLATFTTFAPDLVVFDTHAPMRVVRALVEKGIRSVLVLRELRPEAMASFIKSGAARFFDRIVVPHDPSEIDERIFADLPVSLVGPIAQPPAQEKESPTPLVVATAGGGGQPVDAARYLRAVVDAHVLARARFPSLETIVVTGPYGSRPPNTDGLPGLTILRETDDMPGLLARATVVVGQAGYNGIAEIRAQEKPAVLVPGYRKAEDQRARALRLARAGAAVIAKPEARAIADRVEALLASKPARDAMRAAHAKIPLVPRNRAAAEAVLRPIWFDRSSVVRSSWFPKADTPRPVWVPKKKRLSVALVAHEFPPKLGGMETVARALASSLLAMDVALRVYTTKRLGAGSADGIVQPLYTPLPPPARIDLAQDLRLTLHAALRDAPDVIHLCNAGLGAWIPKLRAALPAVVTANVHGNDLLAPWVHDEGRPEEQHAARIAGLDAADAVVCVSRFSEELAAARGVARERLHTIENGVDPDRFRPGPRNEALARSLGLEPNDEVVLTVSRLAPRKGHRTVLQAIAKLARSRPRLKYVFTGASDSMRAELFALAAELGIGSRIIAAGFVEDALLSDLYRLADVFALLADGTDTDVEGFGVALLEAAATGLAVIGSKTGGIPEAVADGETGILVAPDEAASAIERLLDAKSLRRALGERGRERVLRDFTQARAAERMLAVWNDILARGPRTVQGTNAVALVRESQERAAQKRAEREARSASFRANVERGRVVRLRATGPGARLLPDALEDCKRFGHAPLVDLKLRRFLDPDFQEHALPFVSGVELVHGVPFTGNDALIAAARGLSRSALAKVKTLRLFLTPEARENGALAIAAVPEAHALRLFFKEAGAVVVPPPELMRYLAELPAGGPETGMIEPTNLCNLACPTCPTGTGKIKPLPQMTLDRFDRALDALGPKLRNLALWNYGEPLLNRALPEMIAHAKKAGVRVVKVSSNVHFLDGARGRALLESGLDVLILSVDGASQETYAAFRKEGDFDRVARSVAWLCEEKKKRGLQKPRIELQFIVMRHNEHELPEMRRLAREWGVDRLRVKTVGADDEATRDLVPATRLLSRYQADGATPNVRHAFCTMAWDHAVVNVDGSVTPCCYLRPDMGDAFVMGNVFETDFDAIWRGEKYRAFRAAMLAGRETMPVCNRCRGGTHDLIAAVEEVAPS